MPRSQNADQQSFIDQASQELFNKFQKKPKKAEWAKEYLAGDFSQVSNPMAKEIFDEAMRGASYEGFRDNVISQISLGELYLLNQQNGVELSPIADSSISGADDSKALADLRKVTGVEDKFDGICTVKTSHGERNISGENLSRPFPIHSVGKVFTGVLIAEMIAQGKISEADLNKRGVELDRDVEKELPETVRTALKGATLHEVMTHKANLPDYLEKYSNELAAEIDNPTQAAGPYGSRLKEPQDFLPYVEKNKIEQNNYSNVGILIAGLAAQHYYNKGQAEQKPYSEILREMVLTPAKIKTFSETPLPGALIDPNSKVQGNLCGSPAGGYWTNALEMQKFGDHLCERMEDKDGKFRSAVEKYGEEFYNSQTNTIQHAGDLGPEEANSCFFSVHIPSRTSLIMSSNSITTRFVGEMTSGAISTEQKELEQNRAHAASSEADPLSSAIVEATRVAADLKGVSLENALPSEPGEEKESFVEKVMQQPKPSQKQIT